jgi:hypothetical protein
VTNIEGTARRNEKTLKTMKAARDHKRGRALQRKRGDGEIYDVIDEWLAPLFARWIANRRDAVHMQVLGNRSNGKD